MFGEGSQKTGTTIIERNRISEIEITAQAIIRNNTIEGVQEHYIHEPLQSYIYNNLHFFYLVSTSIEVNATNNWWGTTNTTAIDKAIIDFKDDFNLGKVNCIPFLAAVNPYAMPDPNAPIPNPNGSPSPPPSPSPNPSPSQSPTPDQNNNQTAPIISLNGIEAAILIVLIVIALLLAGIFTLMFKRNKTRQPKQRSASLL